MKFSEATAKLEENPKQKYEAIDHYGDKHELSASGSGFLYYKKWGKDGVFLDPDKYGGGHFNGNIAIGSKEYNWQLVREPVPAWEAVKAFCEGKKVSYITPEGDEWQFAERSLYDVDRFINSKWYIND